MNDFYPSDYDLYLFHEGTHYLSYNFLGSHPCQKNGTWGVRFSVWAPAASQVSVIGDFNHWQDNVHSLTEIGQSGIWTIFIPGIKNGALYKYRIRGPQGKVMTKADPYAFYSEKEPGTASIVYSLENYQWHDKDWLSRRNNTLPHQEPLLIYELHAGSWYKDGGDWPNFRDLADSLVPYLVEMEYTHLELLPVTEYPFGGSWGYQATGFFSLTSRGGTPHDFMYFVDKCHQNQIGVIIDWVPSHFCKDDHGLRKFDGTPLFESTDPLRAENLQWDTLNFDFDQAEVWSFLISSANFWFDKYHIDGIRVDAVSNIIYLNYQKDEGQWTPNQYGGNENIAGINFIKRLNETIFDNFPGALMIAEESTDWPKVTAPTTEEGLGYNFKWNMGWMNDTLKFMELDPVYRKGNLNLLTFSLVYTYAENYILPLSHDEVVHGKKSLLSKMPGNYEQKFANLRLLYGYMTAHPGKKLLFMGGELGHFIEWDYTRELDWHLLGYDKHQQLKDYVQDLNRLYQKEKSLWHQDHDPEGFQWIDADDIENCVLSFIRTGAGEKIVAVSNFSTLYHQNYKIGVPKKGIYKEILNSSWELYGGSQPYNKVNYTNLNKPLHSFPYSISLNIPPLSFLVLKYEVN